MSSKTLASEVELGTVTLYSGIKFEAHIMPHLWQLVFERLIDSFSEKSAQWWLFVYCVLNKRRGEAILPWLNHTPNEQATILVSGSVY